jgi:hypothetical protein
MPSGAIEGSKPTHGYHSQHHPSSTKSRRVDSNEDNNTNNNVETSPPKRFKKSGGDNIGLQTPYNSNKQRPSNMSLTPNRQAFGERVIQDSDHQHDKCVMIDTSLMNHLSHTSNTEGTVVSSVTGCGSARQSQTAADESITSDTNTEVSSVAHLRGWLDGFGKQHKEHYEKNTKIGQAPEDAERPTRPKVTGSAQKQNRPTPLPPPAASLLAKRLVDTGLPRAAPVRIQTKLVEQDVRATNEGYKSVKELSAWLADDPTKSKKKVLCLRRGANVIAKSRVFDKGLKDVVIEQDYGRTTVKGLVASKKKLLAPTLKGLSSHDTDDSNTAAQDWPINSDYLETASSLDVSSKKEWLVNAFKRDGPMGTAGKMRAQTEVVTAQDEQAAVSNRAKSLWRQRSATRDKLTEDLSNTPNNTVSSASSKQQMSMVPHNQQDDPSPTKYGFAAAREFLVQKSRQNGNPVDVHKVKDRTAKFERLGKERNQVVDKTVKTSWVETASSSSSSSFDASTRNYSSTFVKTLVSNKAPQKSLHELP